MVRAEQRAHQDLDAVRDFLAGRDRVEAAVRAYVQAVKDGSFPAAEHSF